MFGFNRGPGVNKSGKMICRGCGAEVKPKLDFLKSSPHTYADCLQRLAKRIDELEAQNLEVQVASLESERKQLWTNAEGSRSYIKSLEKRIEELEAMMTPMTLDDIEKGCTSMPAEGMRADSIPNEAKTEDPLAEGR